MNPRLSTPFNVLIADDDLEDIQLLVAACKEYLIPIHVDFVENGQELIDRLDPNYLPSIIFLDLNMPKKGGIETLKEIKSKVNFKEIPVIIFSTSALEEDIVQSYKFGANCYINKPSTYSGLVGITQQIFDFWLTVARLPRNCFHLN